MKRPTLVLVLLLAAAGGSFALGSPESPFVLVPNVRFFGADMTVGYRGLHPIPQLGTTVWAHVGGGWEQHKLYRDFSIEDVVGVPLGVDDPKADYNKWTLDAQLGLAQGILWSDRLGRNLLEAVIQSRWRLESYRLPDGGDSSLILDSSLPDRDGLFLGTFLGAVHLDGVQTVSRRRTHNGVDAEISAEWAPAGFLGSPADFVRLNGHLEGLVTLVEAKNVALVAGDHLEGDLLLSPTGELSTIPVWARTTLGGVNPDGFGGQAGLGGAVRGVASERFDGTLKIVNNLEVRLLFPEILPVAIFPGLIVFVDAGTSDFRGLDRAPVLPDDLFVSFGAGLDLRALVADVVVYASYCALPEEARGFKVDFRFSTQF